MTTTYAKLAARIDDNFDYDTRVRDAVLDELAAMCKTKKVSAAKLKDSIIISCIESHMADLEDDAPAEDEGTMTDEINAASLEGMRDALDADEPEVIEEPAEDVEPAPKKTKRPMGSHADCDHPATKAGRARCRRERAKAAAAEKA